MPYNPAEGFNRVMPGLHYEDVAAALEWLGEAFRLQEHLRWADPETGKVRHAEMRYGDNAFVELSDGPHNEGLLVIVDDVDEHFANAKAHGAEITSEPRTSRGGCVSTDARTPKGTTGASVNGSAMCTRRSGAHNWQIERMDPLKRLRKICLAMPDASEKLSHGEPTWFAGKVFAMYSDHHHDDEHVCFWCPQPPGAQEALVASDPKRFFVPPYVGGKGWIGVRLDVEPVDWDEIAELVEESYRLVGPKVGALRLDERLPGNSPADKKRVYSKLGKICLALPDATEKPFGGHWAPAWRVEDKIFCSTGQVGRARMTIKGARGAQEALVQSEPDRFFVPDYSGSKGWIGAWLDVEQDWDEITELIEESYRLVAPKKLVAKLEEQRA